MNNIHISKINLVLNYINALNNPYRQTFDEIKTELSKDSKKIEITSKDLPIIISKLNKDGYIREEFIRPTDSIPHYFMTYEGIELESDGGYQTIYSKKKRKSIANRVAWAVTIIGIIISAVYLMLNYNISSKKFKLKETELNRTRLLEDKSIVITTVQDSSFQNSTLPVKEERNTTKNIVHLADSTKNEDGSN